MWTGDPAEGERVLAPLRAIGTPIADVVQPMPYLFIQTLLDAGNPHGAHYYWRSQRIPDLTARRHRHAPGEDRVPDVAPCPTSASSPWVVP